MFHAIAIQLLVDFGLGSPAILGSFGESFRGFSEETRTRGFPPPFSGGFGFIGVASDLSIVAAWRIGSGSPMAALGRQRPLASLSAQRPLPRVKRTSKSLIIRNSDFRFRPRLCENPPNFEDDGTAPHIGYKGVSNEILISHIGIE